MIVAWVGSILLFCVVVLYVLLTLGLPLGEYAMGGKHRVLPSRFRITSAISAVIQLFAILVILQLGNIFSIGLPHIVTKGFGIFFGSYLIINTFLNAISKSRKERNVMTPLAGVTAICFLLTVFNS